MLHSGDVTAAEAAAAELGQIAQGIEAPYLLAVAETAQGAVLLARGEAREALPRLRQAADSWRDLDCPYELARTRVLVGLACGDLGDAESAAMEIEGARATFLALEAMPDLERLESRVSSGPLDGPTIGPTPRELDVLKLVAEGLTNRAIANELGLSEKTVARHVSNLLARLDLPSRAAATAYAYQHGLL